MLCSDLAGCVSAIKGSNRREGCSSTFNCTALLFHNANFLFGLVFYRVDQTDWKTFYNLLWVLIVNYKLLVLGSHAAYVPCTQQAAFHRDFGRKCFISLFTDTYEREQTPQNYVCSLIKLLNWIFKN